MLQEAGVPAGAVLDPRDQCNDPHVNDRGFLEEIHQEDCGTHRYPGMMWKFTKTPLKVRRPPVRLGEDNEYVYKELLGLSDEEYEDLVDKGHIGTEYAAGAKPG
jgi:crotonobetainyl-CoA:carnitine CoA-transferase CaiB-like acyl-CoA transferase